MDIRIVGIFLKNAFPEAAAQNHVVKAGLLLTAPPPLIVAALLNTLLRLLSLELLEEARFEEHNLRLVIHLHRAEKGKHQGEKSHPRLQLDSF